MNPQRPFCEKTDALRADRIRQAAFPAMQNNKQCIDIQIISVYNPKNARYTEKLGTHEIGGDAKRQYVDALSTFAEWERSVKEAAEVRGGMYWKPQGKTDYLIRTATSNSQKSGSSGKSYGELGWPAPLKCCIYAVF